MVPGWVPASITTVSVPTEASLSWRRAYSAFALPSERVAGRSGRTSVTASFPMVGSTSLASGLTLMELVAPACTWT